MYKQETIKPYDGEGDKGQLVEEMFDKSHRLMIPSTIDFPGILTVIGGVKLLRLYFRISLK